MPSRLRRFVERGQDGLPTGRVAYVLKLELLGTPANGREWQPDPSFNAAEAVLKDASLKEVYRSAIDEGIAITEDRN